MALYLAYSREDGNELAALRPGHSSTKVLALKSNIERSAPILTLSEVIIEEAPPILYCSALKVGLSAISHCLDRLIVVVPSFL